MSITIRKILHFVNKLRDIKKTFEKVTHFTPLHPIFLFVSSSFDHLPFRRRNSFHLIRRGSHRSRCIDRCCFSDTRRRRIVGLWGISPCNWPRQSRRRDDNPGNRRTEKRRKRFRVDRVSA